MSNVDKCNKNDIEIINFFPVEECEDYPMAVIYNYDGREYLTFSDDNDFEHAALESLQEKHIMFEDLTKGMQSLVLVIEYLGLLFLETHMCGKEEYEECYRMVRGTENESSFGFVAWSKVIRDVKYDSMKFNLHRFIHNYNDGNSPYVEWEILSVISFPKVDCGSTEKEDNIIQDDIKILKEFYLSKEVADEDCTMGVWYSYDGRKYVAPIAKDEEDCKLSAIGCLSIPHIRYEDLHDVTQVIINIIIKSNNNFYGCKRNRDAFEDEANILWPKVVADLVHDILRLDMPYFCFCFGDGKEKLCVYWDIITYISFPDSIDCYEENKDKSRNS